MSINFGLFTEVLANCPPIDSKLHKNDQITFILTDFKRKWLFLSEF